MSVKAEDLKLLQTAFNDSWKELKGLLDSQAEQVKLYGETSTETADKIKNVEEKLVDYDKEVKGMTDKFTELETKLNRDTFQGGKDLKTVGQEFIESEAYKNMIKNGGLNTQPVQVKSFMTKDLDSTGANGGYLVSPLRVPEIIRDRDRELRLRDVLNVQRTASNAIEYIQETGFINSSAPVAEKDLKPESDISFEPKTATISTIAHWIPATRQIISDATQLQNYISTRLMTGLALTEENQILYGDGTGENLQGIMTNPLIQDHGAMGGDTMIDHIRRAMTRAIVAGYPVTAIVLHPADWAEIQLQKGDDGHYIWITVTEGGQARLWAVPVVQSLGMTEGEFLLGGFGLGATIYDLEQASIRISDQHGDFFLRNMLAILCEQRIGLVTFRPESFVRGSFEAGA
jgi:HK97 family phage major capsid protein